MADVSSDSPSQNPIRTRPSMFRRPGQAAFILATALGLVYLLYHLTRPHPPLPPLQVSLWYWHQPFKLSKTESEALNRMGVRELFVHAGTFKLKDQKLDLVLPQRWASPTSLPVHLVFNFDYGIVRAFPTLPSAGMATSIERLAEQEIKRAEAGGIKIAGIQLDFDCPTSRLPKYAEILRTLHTSFKKRRLRLSATGLSTWLSSRNLNAVVDNLDFLVPQFYEAETPANRADFTPIFSPGRLERGLRSANRLDKPFYAGLPAYGHALVYDDKDHLMGMYRDAGPDETANDPRFKLVVSYPSDAKGRPATRSTYIGEDIVDFAAPSPNGQRQSWHIRYDLPSPTLVEKAVATVKAHRPPNCRGIILFRIPEPKERMAAPLPGIETAISGRPLKPDIQVSIRSAAAPWEMIDVPKNDKRLPQEVTVTVTNRGSVPTFFDQDSVVVNLQFDRPGFSLPAAAGSTQLETFLTDLPFSADVSQLKGVELASSSSRANQIRVHRVMLGAGESFRIGPIRIPADGATHVRGFWSARGVGGFDTLTGQIANTHLGAATVP